MEENTDRNCFENAIEPQEPHTLIQTPPTTPATEGNENTHPEEATIEQIIKEEISPLRDAIETLTEVYIEEPKWCTDLSALVSKLIESIPGEGSNKRGDNSTSDDRYNISALQFQAAMLQPCNGQIMPAAVRDEIDRLYQVEKAHKIAERAERALNLILDNTQIMIKMPENQDDRLLLISVLNEWYTQAYPRRPPLKLSSKGEPDRH